MPTPTDASIACSPKPKATPVAVVDAVADERRRDRDLDEPDVAGPEREDRRDVHQQEHERRRRAAPRGCRTRASPSRPRAAGTSSRRTGRGSRALPPRAAHDAEPEAGHGDDALHRAHPLEPRRAWCRALAKREQEERDADREHDHEARERPARGSSPWSGRRPPAATTGTRSKTRCAKTVPTSVGQRPLPAAVDPPVEDGDARELADPAGQHRVREQADAEGREDEQKLG